MAKSPSYIWYACYGSNLLEARFHCYIAGGQPDGSTKVYEGCRDKTLPKTNRSIVLPHALYFAKSAKTWHGGGVAFINPDSHPGASTLGRRYLITNDQFTELVRQESQLEHNPRLDFAKAQKEHRLLLSKQAWYNQLIFLGSDRGVPIFTFTHNRVFKTEFNPPNPAYLKTIIKGIKSCYALSDQEILAYFLSKPGVKEHFEIAYLSELIAAL